MRHALYRLRQGLRALWAQVRPPAPPCLGELGGLLTEQQEALFRRMSTLDQQHCLAVAQRLQAKGYRERALLQAALLHDAGKSQAHIAVWQRTAHVLLGDRSPRLLRRLSAGAQPGSRRWGLHVLSQHERLGACLAEEAGFAADVAALLRGEGRPEWQEALRWADNAS